MQYYIVIGCSKISKSFYITPSFGAGFFSKGDGKDLGNSIQFRSMLEFSYEMKLIRWRINKFLNFIIKLKDKGKKPSTIIICDSTSVDIPFYTHNIKPPVSELSNIFVPKYYAFWIHNTILGNLKEIFK